MGYPTQKKPWRDRCPQLHDAVAKIHAVLTAENWQQEVRALPRQIEARRKQWSDYEKDWEQHRLEHLEHFEKIVATDPSMRDRTQDLGDTHCWDSLFLPLTAGDVEDVLQSSLNPFYRDGRRSGPGDSTDPHVGEVYLEGWVPHELSNRDFDKRFHFVPPVTDTEDLTRPHNRLEILATLVFVHDADGDFPPLIPKDDPSVHGMTVDWVYMRKMFERADDTWAKPLGSWLDSLDPEPGNTKADDPPNAKAGKWGVTSLEDIPVDDRSALLRPDFIVEFGLREKRANYPEFLRDMMEAGIVVAYWPKGKQRAIVDLRCFDQSTREALKNPPSGEKPLPTTSDK